MWGRLVLLCAALVPALGLYEEEAGRYDWHLSLFRNIEAVEWSDNGRRVFYGAGKGVVGSLSSKSGSIVWRRIVNGDVKSMLKTSAGVVVCTNNQISLFGDDGSLLWEQQFPSSEDVIGVVAQPETLKPHIIIRSGKTVKSIPLTIESPSSIYLVNSEQATVSTLTSETYSTAVVKGSSLYVINYATSQVHSGNLFTNNKNLKAVSLQKGEQLHGVAAGYITVKAGSQCRKISGEKIEGVACVAGERFFEGKNRAVRITKSGDSELVDEDGVTLWQRNDGLSNVFDIQALEEHPEVESEIDSGSAIESYTSLLINQVTGIQKLLDVLPATISRVSAVVRGEKLPTPTITTNRFGLKKNLILTSKSSLYFMNSANGNIIWERSIGFFGSSNAEFVKVFKSKSKENHQSVLIIWTTENGKDTMTAIDESGNVLSDISSETFTGLQVGTVAEEYSYTHNDARYSGLVLLVKNSDKYETYPKSAKGTKTLFYHTLNNEKGIIEGHRLQDDGTTFTHWKVSLVTDPSEVIVATSMATFNPHQYVVTDSIKIHGNKTSGKNELLIKYVNPNAVLVVTAVPPKEEKQDEEQSNNKRNSGGYLVCFNYIYTLEPNVLVEDYLFLDGIR